MHELNGTISQLQDRAGSHSLPPTSGSLFLGPLTFIHELDIGPCWSPTASVFEELSPTQPLVETTKHSLALRFIILIGFRGFSSIHHPAKSNPEISPPQPLPISARAASLAATSSPHLPLPHMPHCPGRLTQCMPGNLKHVLHALLDGVRWRFIPFWLH